MDSDTSGSRSARISNAKAFLKENPTERVAHVAQMFNIQDSTLRSSIASEKKLGGPGSGGQNKILEEHQVGVIHQFIRSLLTYGIQPSHGVVFSAIIALKRAQDPRKKPPSERWFRSWWKSHNLHEIKTKSTEVVRFAAAEEKDIKTWFVEYEQALKSFGIKNSKDIINFDEAGFRVGCMKGHEILVPKDVLEFYDISPENRKSLTIFECIDAAGNPPPPPLILISGQEIMVDWFPEGLPAGTRVISSENDFTTDEIALEFLQHYIDNSDCGPEADWKLMLMDNHGRHCTQQFIDLANKNHLRPYPLIPHLTHCMQPLDVGIFQPYKHWHDVAIQDALLEFDIESTVPRFLGDLTKIRDNTFKEGTIRHAFEKSGMWPPNVTKCIEQLKTFSPTLQKQTVAGTEPPLPTRTSTRQHRTQPTTMMEVASGLEAWQAKIKKKMVWSDSVRLEEFDSFVECTKAICTRSVLNEVQLSIYRKLEKRQQDSLQQQSKRLKPSGSGRGPAKELAEQPIPETEEKQPHHQFMKLWRIERDAKYTEGVTARRKERARARKVKALQAQRLPLPPELEIPIPDPDAIWKASNPTWQAEEARKATAKRNKEEEEENTEYIVLQ